MKHVSSPKIICWQATGCCNLECPYCLSREIRNKKFTRDDNNTLLRMKDLGVKKISISGGEPLLYNNITSIINTANKLDISLVVTTNGTLIESIDIEAIKKLEYLKISIQLKENFLNDSMIPLEIKHIIKKLQRNNIFVGINFILSKATVESIEMLFRESIEIGVYQVLLLTYKSSTRIFYDRIHEMKDKIDSIQTLLNNFKGVSEHFPGGAKIIDTENDYGLILLTPENYLKFPGNDSLQGEYPLQNDRVYINGKQVSMNEIFQECWLKRQNSTGIYTL